MKKWQLVKENFEFWDKVHPYSLYRPSGEICVFLDQDEINELATLFQNMATYNPSGYNDTGRLNLLRNAMYKMIDPILKQGKPPNVSQYVLLSIVYALLEIVEGDLIDYQEEVK